MERTGSVRVSKHRRAGGGYSSGIKETQKRVRPGRRSLDRKRMRRGPIVSRRFCL